jgi:hypothetical protein
MENRPAGLIQAVEDRKRWCRYWTDTFAYSLSHQDGERKEKRRNKEWGEQRGKMKNTVFWDVTPCGSCKNRRLGETCRFHHQDGKIQWTRNIRITNNGRKLLIFFRSLLLLLVSTNVPSWPIFHPDDGGYIFPETSVLTGGTQRQIQKTAFFIVTAVKSSNLT